MGPQGHPAGWGSSDSSCLAAPATYLPVDPRDLTVSSAGACWAECWAPLFPVIVHDQREKETDCLGQVDGDQSRGRAHRCCTDYRSPAVLKRVQMHPLAVAVVAAAVVVVHHGRAHCTLFHGALMEDKPLPQDACNSTYKTKV